MANLRKQMIRFFEKSAIDLGIDAKPFGHPYDYIFNEEEQRLQIGNSPWYNVHNEIDDSGEYLELTGFKNGEWQTLAKQESRAIENK